MISSSKTLQLLLAATLATSMASAACDSLFKVVVSTNKTLADSEDVKELRLNRLKDIVQFGMLFSVDAHMPLHTWGLPEGSDAETDLQVAIGSVDELNEPMTILPVELQDPTLLDDIKLHIETKAARKHAKELRKEQAKWKRDEKREQKLKEQAVEAKDKGLRRLVTALESASNEEEVHGNLRHGRELSEALNSPICQGISRGDCMSSHGAYNCHAFCGVPLICNEKPHGGRQLKERAAQGNMASPTFWRQLTVDEEDEFDAVEHAVCDGIHQALASWLGVDVAIVAAEWKCALEEFEETWDF